MRIAIAGFQHETNTFARKRAELTDFEIADSWPEMLLGEAVISGTLGMNVPIAGAIQAAADVELIPIVWCAAEPCSYVSNSAYKAITARIVAGVKAAGLIDGIYLDLHGAMVTESFEDGEGELLRQLRHLVGSELPIGISLDSHANITPLMVELATVMTVYRSYPHLDMAETGNRCMQALKKIINGQTYVSAFRQIPFLIPLHAQYTGKDPAQRLYQKVASAGESGASWAEFAAGFTAADIYHCGPSVVAYAESKVEAELMVDTLYEEIVSAKTEFDTALLSDEQAVCSAFEILEDTTVNKPVVIADVQDNPGAGGTSDTTGLLKALINNQANGAILGVLCDKRVAGIAHEHQIGDRVHFELGAKSDLVNQTTISAEFRILALSNGKVVYTGEMYGGGVAELGPSCLLAVQQNNVDVQVVVSSQRIQCLDQALFTHFGVDLFEKRIIVVKSTAHFHADFNTIASCIINAASPGVFSCQLDLDAYQNLRPGVECL